MEFPQYKPILSEHITMRRGGGRWRGEGEGRGGEGNEKEVAEGKSEMSVRLRK